MPQIPSISLLHSDFAPQIDPSAYGTWNVLDVSAGYSHWLQTGQGTPAVCTVMIISPSNSILWKVHPSHQEAGADWRAPGGWGKSQQHGHSLEGHHRQRDQPCTELHSIPETALSTRDLPASWVSAYPHLEKSVALSCHQNNPDVCHVCSSMEYILVPQAVAQKAHCLNWWWETNQKQPLKFS